MRIAMRDGRVFEGTAGEIVKAMKNIAFNVERMTLEQYMDWVVENARRFEQVELKVQGSTEEERAATLVEEMVRHGLAAR